MIEKKYAIGFAGLVTFRDDFELRKKEQKHQVKSDSGTQANQQTSNRSTSKENNRTKTSAEPQSNRPIVKWLGYFLLLALAMTILSPMTAKMKKSTKSDQLLFKEFNGRAGSTKTYNHMKKSR